MSTFGLTYNLKSPDRNKQYISNISRRHVSRILRSHDQPFHRFQNSDRPVNEIPPEPNHFLDVPLDYIKPAINATTCARARVCACVCVPKKRMRTL